MKSPKWLRGIEERDLPPLSTMTQPTIAIIPRPTLNREDDPLNTATLISKGAALLLDQIRNERERSAKLGGEAVEAITRNEGDRKKIALLEADNAELATKVQMLSAELHEKTRILQDLRGALEGMGVQRREPIPRKRNHKKESEPCIDPSQSLPLSSPPEALPPPPSPSTAMNAPTPDPTGHIASSTENDVGTGGTA